MPEPSLSSSSFRERASQKLPSPTARERVSARLWGPLCDRKELNIWHFNCHIVTRVLIGAFNQMSSHEAETAVLYAGSALEETALADSEVAATPVDSWPEGFIAKLRQPLRLLFSFPAALLSVLGLIVFLMARNGFNDPDIWWHMRNAEYLFTHLQFPRVDMYSFTVAGHPWINPEWLGEIPFYLAFRAW